MPGDFRVRQLNDRSPEPGRDYVLYWMHASRRLSHNHALDYALRCSQQLNRPVVVYEGLRRDYPWASRRLHRFVMEGMRDNALAAAALGLAYWAFVETPDDPGAGLLLRLASRACLVVTDDFPAFVVPGQSRALASRADTAVLAVDSNGVVPLSQLGPPTSAAVHLRRRVHKAFSSAWRERSRRRPRVPRATQRVEPPFELWNPALLEASAAAEWLDPSVPAVPATPGGTREARRRLRRFIRHGLPGYAARRSQPAPPQRGHASGLSPYLHFGHISVEEVVAAVLGSLDGWGPERLSLERVARRDGFFSGDADVDAFLDEAMTWRDLGYHWHWHRRQSVPSLKTALPKWAYQTLCAHAGDARPYLYSAAQLEAGETADPIWNAAQRELVATGSMHNYLRMLWGKKVIEWTRSPEQAYRVLVHLNNKYALDGRDPNSWSGILWCFGLFDRPWGPERPVFGKVRYMSSKNTRKKFDLGPYLAYVEALPTIAHTRAGGFASKSRETRQGSTRHA